MVYFIVGPNGVGKTYFAKEISKKYRIPMFDTGPILRSVHKKLQTEESFSEWVSDNEKKYGNDFAISTICKEIESQLNNKTSFIVVGNRCIEGISYVIEFFCLTDYRLIYLDASFDCLKKNYKARENKILSDKEFESKIVGGNIMGLSFLKQFACENVNQKCFYYYKNNNEDLVYANIFANILKRKRIVKNRKKS